MNLANTQNLCIGSSDGTLTGNHTVVRLLYDGTAVSSLRNFTKNANVTSSNSGVIIPITDAIGYKTFNLYTHTVLEIKGSQSCLVEVSPDDVSDIWFSSGLSINPGSKTGSLVLSTPTVIVGRRIRVSITSSINSGTFNIWLVGAGN